MFGTTLNLAVLLITDKFEKTGKYSTLITITECLTDKISRYSKHYL